MCHFRTRRRSAHVSLVRGLSWRVFCKRFEYGRHANERIVGGRLGSHGFGHHRRAQLGTRGPFRLEPRGGHFRSTDGDSEDHLRSGRGGRVVLDFRFSPPRTNHAILTIRGPVCRNESRCDAHGRPVFVFVDHPAPRFPAVSLSKHS